VVLDTWHLTPSYIMINFLYHVPPDPFSPLPYPGACSRKPCKVFGFLGWHLTAPYTAIHPAPLD
jgi:hypothetical protein